MLDWLLILLVAWAFAELASGVFHWLEDRYGNPDWPILGPLIVLPNLAHHVRPGALCQGSYWNRNNTTIVTSLIGAACFFWCLPVCLGFLILSQGNEVHSWAHQRCNRLIRSLQWIGVLQSPRQHAIHHKQPFDRYYCVFTNYANPLLHAIRFWEALELAIWCLTGIKPRPERALA